MRTLALAFMAITLTASLAFAQTVSAQTPQEKELIKLDTEWSEAFKRGDREALGRILDNDFIAVDEHGGVINKSGYLDSLAQQAVTSYILGELTVRVHGDTGIVVGKWSGKLSVGGKEESRAFRFTDVFVKHEGRWRAVASQSTRIAS